MHSTHSDVTVNQALRPLRRKTTELYGFIRIHDQTTFFFRFSTPVRMRPHVHALSLSLSLSLLSLVKIFKLITLPNLQILEHALVSRARSVSAQRQ